MGRGTKVFALAILSVIVAALALWVLSPWLAGSMVANALQARGVDNVVLDMARPGLSQARVSHLAFDIDDGATSVRVEGIEVGYALPELVEGRVRSLSAQEVHVTHRRATQTAASLALPVSLPGFDPEPFFSLLPVDGITLSRVTLSTPDGETMLPPLSLEVSRGENGDSALAVAAPIEPGAADRAFEVVVDRRGRINGALAWADASVTPALEFSARRSDDSGTWTGRVSADADAVGEWLAPLAAIDLPFSDCRMEAAVRLDDNPLDALHVDADLSDCRLGDMDFASGSLRGRFMRTANGLASVTPARLSLEGTTGPGFEARSMVLSSGVDVDLADGSVALPGGATLRASDVTAGDIEAREVTGTLRESVRVNLAAPRGRVAVDVTGSSLAWRGNPVTLSGVVVEWPFGGDGASLPVLRAGKASINAGEISATADSVVARPQGATFVVEATTTDVAQANGSAGLRNVRVVLPLEGGDTGTLDAQADAVALDAAGYRARLEGFAGRVDWRDGLNADFDARLAGVMPVNGRLEADAGAASGRLVIDGPPVVLGEDVERASVLVEGWPAGIDLVGGRAGFTVDVAWNPGGVEASARVDLDGVGGVAHDVYFSDATTTLELEVYPALRTVRPAQVRMGAVDYGLALTGVEASVTLDGKADGVPVVSVADARADAFDGVVRLADFDSGERSFVVLLENVDLARLVGEDRFPGLSMSGRVGGRVPVEIRDDGVYINRGLVESSGGGMLHYDPGNVGAGSGAEILFKALKEFEYSVLRVEPEYRPDGKLTLAVHMEGTSAEIGRSQPIHFNVNVEQNLLKLLESLRLVDGLNERIDRSVQQYYQRSR